MIADAIKRILQNNLVFLRPPGLIDPLDINLQISFNYHDVKFYTAKFGFFNPYFDSKSTKIGVDIKHT